MELGDRLFQITFFSAFPGFDDFIGVYLHAGSPAFLVDVGPSVTVAQLFRAMDRLSVRRLDYILLTHIHLDHAGAVGEVSARFPMAKVVCHPSAFPHLLDPTRLLRGTVKTLGDIGKAYGPIQPLDEKRLADAIQFDAHPLCAIPTPGHAPHHVSYLFGSTLFAGEAGGVCLPFASTAPYLRPATPPRFFLKTTIDSIDALIAADPSHICYGHIGRREDARGMLEAHRRQLLLWSRIVDEESRRMENEELPKRLLKRLLTADSFLSKFFDLPPDVRKRETFFLMNSISGFVEALETFADNP